MVVVNILDTNLARSLVCGHPGYVRLLQHLAEDGAYVTFVSSNSSLLSRLSREFNPPLFSYPSPPATITKILRNGGRVERVIENLLIATGGTYLRINGRLVPAGASSITAYGNHTSLSKGSAERAQRSSERHREDTGTCGAGNSVSLQ